MTIFDRFNITVVAAGAGLCSVALALSPEAAAVPLITGGGYACVQNSAGGAVGGMAGALIGLGIPEYEAKRYEGAVKNGNILISVHTDDSKERDAAKKIFERAHAEDISYTAEARP